MAVKDEIIMNYEFFWGDLEEKNILSMQAISSDGKISWISNYNYNCLVQVEDATNTIIKTERFIGEDLNVSPLHKGVVLYKNKLVFYPNQGTGLNIVDIRSGEQEYISLEEYVVKQRCCKFSTAILQGDILWLIPQVFKQQLLKVDLKRGEVIVQHWWEEKLKEYGVPSNAILFGAEASDNELLVSVKENNFFLKCSLENKSMKRFSLEKDDIALHRVFDAGGFFWCTCCHSRDIYIVSYEGNICRVLSDEGAQCEETPYIKIIFWDEKVFIIPKCGEKILVCNVDGEKITEISLTYRKEVSNKDKIICNYAVDVADNNLILYPNYDGILKIIDLGTFVTDEYEYHGRKILHNYYVKYILAERAQREMLAKGYISEKEESFSLNEYIKYIGNVDVKMGNVAKGEKATDLEESCAEKIMKALKN